MAKYASHVSTKVTPQTQPIPGVTQVPNSAGGFVFEVTPWTRLDRFLILGNDGGTYYASEQKLTQENAACVRECLKLDYRRAIDRIAEISVAGRAPKNDPAIFALALAASYYVASRSPDNIAVRQYALAQVSKVCRIGTHLFQFSECIKQLRGRGRAVKNALAHWFLDKEPRDLAYQLTKYQQRDGWSQADLLRLAKPKPRTEQHSQIFRWAVGKLDANVTPLEEEAHGPILAFEAAKLAKNKEELCGLIRTYNMPRECVPTQWLKEAAVWEALLETMPMTALIRNLATMTRVGLLAPMSNGVALALAKLANGDALKKARVHPVQVLAALLTYRSGQSVRGENNWTPVPQIIDALDAAFYTCFANVEPTGKRWLLGLDVSGSMDMGTVAGVPGLTPRVGVGAMALVTAAVEKQYQCVAFTSGHAGEWTAGSTGSAMRGMMQVQIASGISPLAISARQRLDDVCRTMAALPMGGTDCALPMLYATANKVPVDVFAIFTDNETWAGNVHPMQALREYRQKMGIGAKLIVVGMTSTQFSIADPADGGSMDVVGFDTNAPAAMADFARG